MTQHPAFNLQLGHLVRLGRPFLTYGAGTRAVYVAHDISSLSLESIHLLVFHDGALQALTVGALEALDLHVVGFVPQVRALSFDRQLYNLFLDRARREPGLFTRLLEDRRSVLRTRVRRGATQLDATCPAWWDRIDLGTLDVAIVGRCVVAQLYGGDVYSQLSRVLPPELTETLAQVMREGENHGFLLPGDGAYIEYATLTDLWRTEIEMRRVGAVRPKRDERA